jgi:membrane-bound lytic murein transglycosylase A
MGGLLDCLVKPGNDKVIVDEHATKLVPIDFAELDGWSEDDHVAAFRTFLKSCRVAPPVDAAQAAARALGEAVDAPTARAFFENYFVPHTVEADELGLVTGYYEPEVQGAHRRDERFTVPVYGRPGDLITLGAESERARYNNRISGMRETPGGLVPYYTREEIDAGALAGWGLELLYLDDAIELFYMQVQGSGLVHLDGGTSVRLTYAGKNGHPYTSIGKCLVERGEMSLEEIDMDKVKDWLRADPARGPALMAENESYIFFRKLDAEEGRDGPLGNEGVVLTPGRSLAVDTAHHALGTPVFVAVPGLEAPEGSPFRRLMIGQDVGSAIGGIQRGDIFWGTGEAAGAIAGRTRDRARFHVLLPNR